MPKGKPLDGTRKIDPANKPGPKPMDTAARRRRSIYCSEAELTALRAYLLLLRQSGHGTAPDTKEP